MLFNIFQQYFSYIVIFRSEITPMIKCIKTLNFKNLIGNVQNVYWQIYHRHYNEEKLVTKLSKSRPISHCLFYF